MNTKDNQEAEDEVFDYDEIYEKAKVSYMRHSTSIRGQTMTQQDDPEWHIANEAWQARAKLTTPQVNEEVASGEVVDLEKECLDRGITEYDSLTECLIFKASSVKDVLNQIKQLYTTPSQSNVLVEALRKLARLGNEPQLGTSEGNMIARNALEAYGVKL